VKSWLEICSDHIFGQQSPIPFEFQSLRDVGDTITKGLASNFCSTGIEEPGSLVSLTALTITNLEREKRVQSLEITSYLV